MDKQGNKRLSMRSKTTADSASMMGPLRTSNYTVRDFLAGLTPIAKVESEIDALAQHEPTEVAGLGIDTSTPVNKAQIFFTGSGSWRWQSSGKVSTPRQRNSFTPHSVIRFPAS